MLLTAQSLSYAEAYLNLNKVMPEQTFLQRGEINRCHEEIVASI